MFIGHTNKPTKGQKKGWHYNPGLNVGALSVSGEEIAIQVDPSPPPPPPPPPPAFMDSVGLLQVKRLLHILHTLRSSTLFVGGGGELLLRPCL